MKFSSKAAVMALALLALLSSGALWGVSLLAVMSGSMSPDIPVGSMVCVVPCSFSQIQEGDVVTYRLGDGKILVTHRVVEVDLLGESLTTKGDANEQMDQGRVEASQVKGRVLFSVPFLGYVLVFLGSAPGRRALWIFALVFLGLSFRDAFCEERGVAHA